jgi:hypothetical protein
VGQLRNRGTCAAVNLPGFPGAIFPDFSLLSVFGRRSFVYFIMHDILRFFPLPKSRASGKQGKNPPDIHAAVQDLNFVSWGKKPFLPPAYLHLDDPFN